MFLHTFPHVENFNLLIKLYIPRGYKIDCATEWYMYIHSISCANTRLLENVEHCGGEPEQADTGISCHW